MDIKEIKNEKQRLEHAIYEAIKDFEKKTECKAWSVDIERAKERQSRLDSYPGVIKRVRTSVEVLSRG